MLAMVGNGTRIYTSNMGDNSVAELDVAAGTRTRTFAVPPRPEAITVTRSGDEVWVGSNDSGFVSVVDTRSGNSQKALTGFGWPYRILIAPDNVLVLLPDLRNEELRFVDRASRRELGRMAFTGAAPQGITFAGDGVALLSLSGEDRIAVIEVRSRTVIRHIAAGDGPDGIVFSPIVVRESM